TQVVQTSSDRDTLHDGGNFIAGADQQTESGSGTTTRTTDRTGLASSSHAVETDNRNSTRQETDNTVLGSFQETEVSGASGTLVVVGRAPGRKRHEVQAGSDSETEKGVGNVS